MQLLLPYLLSPRLIRFRRLERFERFKRLERFFHSSPHDAAAIGKDRLAGYETGGIAGQKNRRTGEVFRLTNAAQRDSFSLSINLLFGLMSARLCGIGDAGANNVDGYPVGRELDSEGFGESNNPRLGRGVMSAMAM